MPRPLSDAFINKLLDQAKDAGLVAALKLDYDDGVNVGIIRLVRADRAMTLDGDSFTPGDFLEEKPKEDQELPALRIAIQDADRQVRNEIRKLDPRFPAIATLYLIDDENFPTFTTADVQIAYEGPVRGTRFTKTAVLGKVETFPDLTKEPWNARAMNQANGFNSLRA